MPEDRSLVVGTGPYTLAGLTTTGATLSANPGYRGDHRPKFARVGLKFITDPLASVTALRAGCVDVIAPQRSEDVAKALLTIGHATVLSGSAGPYEHLDLQFAHSRSGTFDNPIVRTALLESLPRQNILDKLVVPLQEEARLRSHRSSFRGRRATRRPCARTARAPVAPWISREPGWCSPSRAW